MTYVAREPEIRTIYHDTEGTAHQTRDAAISRNFDIDFSMVCSAQMRGYSMTPEVFEDAVRRLISFNQDMVRVILGDRDPT